MKSVLSFISAGCSFLLCSTLLLSGCGEKKEGAGGNVANKNIPPAQTTSEVAPDTSGGPDLFSQQPVNATTGVGAEFKEGVISMNKAMIAVIDNVKSVADAEAAEPKIVKAMNDLATLFEKYADRFDAMSPAEQENFRNAQNDPELEQWSEKVNTRTQQLQAEHPDAARKLDEIGQRHGAEMAAAIRKLMAKVQGMKSQ